jgi:hypothetical protein
LNPAVDGNKPFWLSAEEKAACYATPSGWAIRQPSGNEEILVAIRGLSGLLAGANLTSVFFDATSYTAGATGNVIFAFDEAVSVAAGTTTIKVDYDGITAGEITTSTPAVAVTGETNQVAFPFTVPSTGTIDTTAGGSITTPGSGYTDGAAVAVTISGGTGSGCTATASIGQGSTPTGEVGSLTITDGGVGFPFGAVLTITEGSNNDARFTVSKVGGDLGLDIADFLEINEPTLPDVTDASADVIATIADTTPTVAEGNLSAAWQASQTHGAFAPTSTGVDGANATFSVNTDGAGLPTVALVAGGNGFGVGETIVLTDPGTSTSTCTLTVATLEGGAVLGSNADIADSAKIGGGGSGTYAAITLAVTA